MNRPLPPAERDGVWCLGTGSPRLDGDRAGASVLLMDRGVATVVDCGIGALYRLSQLGVRPHQVGAVLLTHHHVDHVADLPALILTRWIAGRRRAAPRLRIVGPRGTREFVDVSLSAYAADIESRIATGWLPTDLSVDVEEMDGGGEVTVGVWRIGAFGVDHRPVAAALGYTVEREGTRIVISGDTRPCSALIEQARGADVLLHEAIYPGYGVPAYHTLAEDVGKVAAEAAVARLVLTHLIPGTLPDEQWLQEARGHFHGPAIVARDLLQVAEWPAPGKDPFEGLPAWAGAGKEDK